MILRHVPRIAADYFFQHNMQRIVSLKGTATLNKNEGHPLYTILSYVFQPQLTYINLNVS